MITLRITVCTLNIKLFDLVVWKLPLFVFMCVCACDIIACVLACCICRNGLQYSMHALIVVEYLL